MSTIEVTTPRLHKPVAIWRKVLAAILDFFFVFYIAGYTVGYFTSDLTDGGFELKGAPALIVFAVVIAYFIVFSRFLGGTIFQRLLGARGGRPRG
jgi:TRAP-type C4-dicarboxylate transport system permease small subunit